MTPEHRNNISKATTGIPKKATAEILERCRKMPFELRRSYSIERRRKSCSMADLVDV